IPALFWFARTTAFSTSGAGLAESGSRFTIEQRTSRIVTVMAGASSPSPNESTPPNHSSSWKGTDHGDARVVEDAMLQLHHLHGSPVPTSDLRGQILTEDRHLFAIRRANMRRKVALSAVVTALRSEQDQVGKLDCCQPWEPAAVIHPPECQASVTIEAVPAQLGNLEPFAGHGLHGISEDRLHLSDFYEHCAYPFLLFFP